MNSHIFKLFFTAGLLLFVYTLPGQGSSVNGDPLFASDDLLKLEMSYDINALRKDKGETRAYHPARLSYKDSQGRLVSLNIQIRVRGKFRRTVLKCQVPNFRIKFNPAETAHTIFAKQSKLKVVAHCRCKPKYYQLYTFKEYYVYKTYQLLSDMHYKVRLAQITYIDDQNDEKPFTQYAFFLENSKRMARRLKVKRVEAKPELLGLLDVEAANLTAVFQFMVGNVDWDFRHDHNIVLVQPVNQGKRIPIPFDFDQTGLVNPHYAIVDSRLNIKYVHQRLFRGFCKDLQVFEKTFNIFNQCREKILDIYRHSPYLPKKQKKRTIKFLQEFFKIINNPKLVKRKLINNYRGRPFPKR
jgi:hypothetical protein